MGSKGSNTTTTNQTQTYAPAGAGYVQNALQQGQNAASLPFNIPQAPVAGFSQDQRNAFQNVNNAQGMAQPYFNQANQYFQQSAQGPNVSQFFNPYAGAVTDQLKNIFGQQNSQNTGQLTQAAGGVGADRIAVGQSQLANQQGLAAGQTLAGLYAPSLQAAQNQQNILQSAGYGTAALGSQAQNAALSGAQAQLGTGGLQQQLSQAQLNSPYQQQLAQAAFPYQQAQFLAGITGSLAPGLGGTTTGQGQTTTPGPSLWSQLIGGGTAATGLLGQTGAFGSNGWMSGNKGSGGGSNYASQPLTGQDAWQNSQLFPGYGTAAQGGAVYPYAEGGSVSDEPIDVAPQSIIPTGAQTPHIQDHIPQLNLNPPQQQSGGGGGGGGLGDVMKLAAMFMARGGAASPYADGGATSYPGTDDNMMFASGPNEKMIRAKRDLRTGLQDKTAQPIAMGAARNQADEIMGFRPRGYADGGGASFADRWSGLDGDDAGVVNPDEPFRMPGQAAVNDWRNGVDQNISAGQTASGSPDQALAFNAPDSTGVAFPPPSGSHGRSVSGATVEPAAAPETSPYAAPAAAAQSDDGTGGFNKFIKSPWAALTAAGLGIMGGTSPYAGVNIGQGAMQGLKLLEQQREGSQKDETIKQAAKRLELEAKHHEDQYTRTAPYQQFEMNIKQKELAQKVQYQQHEMSKATPIGQHIDPTTGQAVTTYGVRQPDGSYKPIDPTAAAPNPAAAAADDAALPANARAAQGFLIPGQNVPDTVDPTVLSSVEPGMANLVRAIDEGRESITKVPQKQRWMVQRLVNAYDPGFDDTVWSLRNKQQSDLSSNGNAGKMLLATNQLMPHLLTASNKAAELANTKYPAANTFANWWLTQTGDPRVKEFQTVREVAATDAARLLRGTGQMAEKDIEEWRKNIGESGSPQQLQGVIKMLADDLIKARVGSIEGLYRMNMRQKPPEFLWPESKAAMERIRENYAAAQPKKPGAPAAAAAAPPAAAPAAAAPADPLAEARAAIAAGAPRDAILKRLQEHGIDAGGL